MRVLVLVVLGAACGRVGFDDRSTDAGADAGADTALSPYVELVLATNPVAYWRLGESVQSVAFDLGPNQWNGTYQASAILGEPGALNGDPDTSAEFAGTAAGVVVTDVLDFAGTVPYSLEVWALPRLIDVDPRAFCGKKTLAEIGYSFFLNDAGAGFGRYNTPGIKSEVYGPLLALDVYSHVVGTFDGTLMTLYVNGAVAGTMANTITLPDRTVAFAIGAKGEGTPGYFTGALDEVAVYDRALDATEVAAHYAAGR